MFVLPCRIAPDGDRDGLPNVLVEAASQGLACVSTTISGVPELINSKRLGVLVPPEEPAALAQAIETLARSPDKRGKLGRAVEQRVRSEFDHNASIRQLMRLFEGEAHEDLRNAAE
jgi:glycosyltransferase involved in cell wall biosynthesis